MNSRKINENLTYFCSKPWEITLTATVSPSHHLCHIPMWTDPVNPKSIKLPLLKVEGLAGYVDLFQFLFIPFLLLIIPLLFAG